MGKRQKDSKARAAGKPEAAKARRRKAAGNKPVAPDGPKPPKEIGGPPGPEPTRYGDWQYKGRVSDF